MGSGEPKEAPIQSCSQRSILKTGRATVRRAMTQRATRHVTLGDLSRVKVARLCAWCDIGLNAAPGRIHCAIFTKLSVFVGSFFLMVACICNLIFFCHNTLYFQNILCCGKFVTTHYFLSHNTLFLKTYCLVRHVRNTIFFEKIMCCDSKSNVL